METDTKKRDIDPFAINVIVTPQELHETGFHEISSSSEETGFD